MTRSVLVREVWIASLGLLLLLTAVKHLAPVVPFVHAYGFTVVTAVELYVPLWLVGKRGLTRETLGLRWDRLSLDLKMSGLWALVTWVPFAIGHHFWQTILFNRTFALQAPPDFFSMVAIHVFVVGLAEELYFRGYLQERMERLWPPARKLLGAPFGKAIGVAAFVFALAHFVGEYQITRLGPFFPGLVFGWLRSRTGTLVGAVLYHGLCNVLSHSLWALYQG